MGVPYLFEGDTCYNNSNNGDYIDSWCGHPGQFPRIKDLGKLGWWWLERAQETRHYPEMSSASRLHLYIMAEQGTGLNTRADAGSYKRILNVPIGIYVYILVSSSRPTGSYLIPQNTRKKHSKDMENSLLDNKSLRSHRTIVSFRSSDQTRDVNSRFLTSETRGLFCRARHD